jgi:hypothetical protein
LRGKNDSLRRLAAAFKLLAFVFRHSRGVSPGGSGAIFIEGNA